MIKLTLLGLHMLVQSNLGEAYLVEREREFYLWSMRSWDLFSTVLVLPILE